MKTKRHRDPVVEFYKRDVDRMALRKNLNLSFDLRVKKLQDAMKIVEFLQGTKKHSRFLKSMKMIDEVFAYVTRNGIGVARYEW